MCVSTCLPYGRAILTENREFLAEIEVLNVFLVLFFNRFWAQSARPANKQDGKSKPARRREYLKGC
jgi:hypothetical protein